MDLLNRLLGGSEMGWVAPVLALGIVLLLIVLGVWALKFVFRASDNVARGGRTRRLTLVEQIPVDQKRMLLLVRRDDVEHLILTSTSGDTVIEGGIAAPVAPQPVARPQTRRPQASQPAPARRDAPSVTVQPQAQPQAARPNPPQRPVPMRANPAGLQMRQPPKPVVQQQPPDPEPDELPPEPVLQPRSIAPERPAPQLVQPARQMTTIVPEPANSQLPPVSRSPLDRLRDLGRSPHERKSASLRHTGLLRAVSRLEPVANPPTGDNDPQFGDDSARTDIDAGSTGEQGWSPYGTVPQRNRDDE